MITEMWHLHDHFQIAMLTNGKNTSLWVCDHLAFWLAANQISKCTKWPAVQFLCNLDSDRKWMNITIVSVCSISAIAVIVSNPCQ
jgi:hypothetical protein